MERYHDRAEAGRELSRLLGHHRGSRPLVLGLAGGGMVVAAEVAAALEGSLDVVVAVPFGPPGDPELCVGAAASDTRLPMSRFRLVFWLTLVTQEEL